MPFLRGLAAGSAFVLGLVLVLTGLVVGGTTLFANLAIGHPLDTGTIITLVSAAGALAAGFGLFWCSRAVGGEYGPIRDYRQRKRQHPRPRHGTQSPLA